MYKKTAYAVPSETGGTTSKTRSDRLPAQPAAFLLRNAGLFIRSSVRTNGYVLVTLTWLVSHFFTYS